MRRHSAILFALTLGACAPAVQAGAADFHPGTLKGPRKGPQNELLVLGTPHLSELPAPFKPAALALLHERLAAWRPQAIAIEALSGPQCAFLRQYPQRYQDSVDSFCWDPSPARAATGLDVPAATAEAEKLLADWPASPSPAQRRRLAAVFLAGGEPASALVQWLRLPEAERRSGDGLDDTLVALLNALRDKPYEDYLIAAPLAARLGHERVYAMDDHSADYKVTDQEQYGVAIMKAWDNPATARRKRESEALYPRLDSAEGVLALYRAYNAPGQAKLTFDSDFGAALEEPSPQRFGRGYVGYWETRNLRMAANIRDALTLRPGTRMLVLVGASHKGYLDAYLDQMHDLRIVDVKQVLR